MLRILATLVMAFSGPSFAGIFTNGGDYSWQKDSVWFLGDEPVEYCIELSEEAPFDRAQASSEVRRALNVWIAFFKRRGLTDLTFKKLARQPQLPLSLNFVEVPECTTPKTQIRFIFGKRNEELQRIRETQPRFVGLAYRKDFDHITLRNGGTVFVDRFLGSGPQFFHMLVHEIGHVFGFPHDSVPMMINHVGEYLNNPLMNNLLGQIESPTWKYRLDDGDELEFSFDGEKDGVAVSNRLLPSSKALFDFDPAGFHRLKLKVQANDEEGPVQMILAASEYPTGKVVTMMGEFFPRGNYEARMFGHSGPVLSSFFHSAESDCEHIVSGKRQLDTRVPRKELEGSFEFGGKVYPAILESKPGSVLSVFLPEVGRWWSVSDYPAVRIWTKP